MADALGLTDNNVRRHLRNMVKDSRVEQVSRGQYSAGSINQPRYSRHSRPPHRRGARSGPSRWQTSAMDPERRRTLVDRLRGMFPAGSPLPGSADGSFVEVREGQDEAVLLLRWTDDPHLYGVPIDLTDTGHEYYYDAYEVASDEEWLDSVGLGVMVSLDTGFRARARRRHVDDYIELRAEGGWPEDDRFCFQDGDPALPGLASSLRSDGLDPSSALKLHAQGRLLAWLVSYENNSTGHPFVGQAVVAAAETDAATLVRIEASPGVPDSVRLDLAYFASQAAAAGGARASRPRCPTSSSTSRASGQPRTAAASTRPSSMRTQMAPGRC